MTVDVYEDHLRYLGYHVPLDTSKMPPTAADGLFHALRDAVDGVEPPEDQIADEVEAERDRILGLISDVLQGEPAAARYGDYVSDAAAKCAALVADNMASFSGARDVTATLTRWFESELKSFVMAVAEDAIAHRMREANKLIDELKGEV